MPFYLAARRSTTSFISCTWPKNYTISLAIQSSHPRLPGQPGSHVMDPVSIVSVLCAAASLSKVLTSGVKSISIFVRQAKNVDTTIEGLLTELSSFAQTVHTIEMALSSPIMQTSPIAQEQYKELWVSLDQSIKDCYATAKVLEQAIDSVKVKKQGFWARSIRQFKLNLNDEDISRLRTQFQTYGTTLSMTLDTINLIATIIAPNRVIETLGAKIDTLTVTMETSMAKQMRMHSRALSDTDTLFAPSSDSILGSSSDEPPILNTSARNEALREAAKTGDVASICSLLTQGVNVNQRDASGATALHYATSCGHDEAVRVLLARANVNAANEEGLTALHLACRRGYHQIVAILLSSDSIDIDLQNHCAETALHNAAYHGHDGCVAALVASANTLLLNKSGEMALHLAAYWGHTECVRLLLSSPNIEPDGRNAWQETGLHLASANGKVTTVEVLMERCNPDSKDGEGKTPLHLAVMKKREEVVKLLLKKANPDCSNAFGQTPRDLAMFGGQPSMISLFGTPIVENKTTYPLVEISAVSEESA